MLVRVHLQYGRDGLDVDLPRDNLTIVAPRYVPGLPDERAAFRAAIASPIASPPLVEILGREDRVAIVIPDITRPLPSNRLLPWLLEAIAHVPDDRIVIVNGTGSHRANTAQELSAMVGAEVLARYRVVNHDSHDPSTLANAGIGQDGQPVLLNRDYVDADRRIVLGFIDTHFMPVFSGGAKAVFRG